MFEEIRLQRANVNKIAAKGTTMFEEIRNQNPFKFHSRRIDDLRPIPFYFITTTDPDVLTYSAIRESAARLKDAGFGGLLVFNKPEGGCGFNAEEYLGEKWFDMTRNFARAGQELDLNIWINDGFNYPPGDVAGRIAKIAPELKQRKIEWDGEKAVVREVDWGFPAFEEPESSELFIKLVYEEYKKNVGEYFGKSIKGFFSDADNRRVRWTVLFGRPECLNYFPWSRSFEESFRDKFKYDIRPHLKNILHRKTCKEAIDYWQHAGDLYQSWFANNYKWCRENGLEYTFHMGDSSPFTYEETPRSSLFTDGRALDGLKNSDYPGTDQEMLAINGGRPVKLDTFYVPELSWGGDDRGIRPPDFYSVYGDLRPKQASSAAFLYKKKGAMSEMFAATNFGASLSDLREVAAWQMMQGITFIIPHGYHHRFTGKLKYFAPPNLSYHGYLPWAMKEFNDYLTESVYFTGSGELNAPVAVLDITDDIWAGKTGSSTLFETCEKLNRMPEGYVIADLKSIAANKDRFKVIVNPGLDLDDGRREILAKLNIPVIEASELSKVTRIVQCGVKYEGEGMPHFMRRTLKDGSVLVILANIEDGRNIDGTITVGENKYNLTLCPGELAFFSKQFTKYREPKTISGNKLHLPSIMHVDWEDDNILPIERWLDSEGRPVYIHGSDRKVSFTFETKADVADVKLYISQKNTELIKSILLDNIALSETGKTKVFDDEYCVFELIGAKSMGLHEIIMVKEGSLQWEDRVFLAGQFDVELKTENPFYLRNSSHQYNMVRYIPEKADICLSTRTDKLRTDMSWTEQGHPFYSGGVVYKTCVEIPEDFEGPELVLPEVGDICEVKVNGISAGRRIWQPYTFNLEGVKGKAEIEINVRNTLANSLEFYRVPSGLLKNLFIAQFD